MTSENSGFPFLNSWQRAHKPTEPWDEVLYETKHFAVVPSLGSLVTGWLLIVARPKALSMASLDEVLLAELDELKSLVHDTLRANFGQVAVFEHGPVLTGTEIGCSVDQAHLHLVPTELGLVEGANRLLGRRLEWKPSQGLFEVKAMLSNRRPYLYVEQKNSCMSVDASELPSQLFRRVLAESLGVPERYDWRQHRCEENIYSTIRQLGPDFKRLKWAG